MFERLEAAPPDAILGLTEAFRNDPNPLKINLGVGVYKDANGETPILECVRQAERRLLDTEATKSYLPIDGHPDYDRLVQALLFEADHEVVVGERAATVQAPGGTGGLRVAADFIKQSLPSASIWCSQPTWPNHPKIFQAAGLDVKSYPYFDATTNTLDFEQMLSGLREIPTGDVVCLHASCHNPSGVDPDGDQWRQIVDVVRDRKLLPLLDFAYQGFGKGLREDAVGLMEFCRPGGEFLVASSFSKNFGLYRERVGAVTAVTADRDSARVVLSRLKASVRANYSNPPFHGAGIVAIVLGDEELRCQWEQELAVMRDRINGMRRTFVDTMSAIGCERDFSFMVKQQGMFSFSGLTPEQVDSLREKHAIYAVRSGRINVGGITDDNVQQLCEAIASVL